MGELANVGVVILLRYSPFASSVQIVADMYPRQVFGGYIPAYYRATDTYPLPSLRLIEEVVYDPRDNTGGSNRIA